MVFELSENERRKRKIRRLGMKAHKAMEWAEKIELQKIGKKVMQNGQKVVPRDYIGEKSKMMQLRRKSFQRDIRKGYC